MTSQSGYVYDLFHRIGLSDFGARTAAFFVVRPIRIGLIVLIGAVFARILARTTERSVMSLHRRTPTRRERARAELRTATMAAALGRLVRLVVWIVVGLLALNELGVNLAPLLAGAGVVGVAVGFGAQSLVRDMLAGLFIIGEDQYGVGDIVDLGLARGTVEEVNLRATRLRAGDGTVWWVPNGQIQRVGNTTMEFSKAVVDIAVPYGTDLAAIGSTMEEEASALRSAPGFADWITEDPVLVGAQSADMESATMRITLTTAPAEQDAVARELRRRILERLRTDGLRPVAVAG